MAQHGPNQGMTDMDYTKGGSASADKKAPKHGELTKIKKKPFAEKNDKAALLARMKAAAEARKTKD
jgi:hypothetical protein